MLTVPDDPPGDTPEVTEEHTPDKGPSPWWVRGVAAVAGLTAATLGYDVGVMADAVLYVENDFAMGTARKEILVGSLAFVSAFGALFAGPLADQFGRRRTLAVCSVLYLVGTALMVLATGYYIMLVGRVLTGIGVGISFVAGPTYIAEVAPPAQRGKLTTVFDICVNVGILAGYVAGFACEEGITGNGAKWRSMLGVGMLFPLAALALLPFLPESPRWLLLRGHELQARDVLASDPSHTDVDKEIEEIKAQCEEEGGLDFSGDRAYLRRVVGMALGVAFWQQATGSEAVLYYSATFLKKAGMESHLLLLVGNMLVGLAKLLPEFIVMVSIDTIGRRKLLLFSSGSMVVAIAMLAVSFAVGLPPVVTIVLLCAFMATFSSGMGPLTFVTCSELLPLPIRAKGMMMCIFVNRLVSGTVALTALSLSSALGLPLYFALYAVVSLLSVFFCHARLVETKGKSLEAITATLRSLPPSRSVLSSMCFPLPFVK
eukprot:Sspe_Gene.69077::Locus_40711_Transcript_1_3_Confidence_0.667_Length_1908::g.69077::m.69077